MISGFHVEQLLWLKLSIDKGEAISNAFVTFSHEWAIAVWSGPCALTPQLPILVDKVLLMIENRLGKNLLCLACSLCCGLSSGAIIGLFSFVTTVWLQNDDSQFHTAYACVEVLMKLAILFQCKFLILVSRLVIITMNC